MKIPQNIAASPDAFTMLKNMGKHIASMRKARNLLQTEVALRANISRDTASRIENGDAAVAVGQIVRYLNAIAPGADLCRLFETEDAALKMKTFSARPARARKMKLSISEKDKYDF